MSKKEIAELKEYFKAAKRPTESQFGDLLDSYAHLNSEIIKDLSAYEYTVHLSFPPNYKVGDYVEFLAFEPEMASASGFYEISVAYTRGSIASAATHIAAVSHANPNMWRECGRINRNNYVADENTDCFTFDVNGILRKFRIRATRVGGVTAETMSVVIKVRSINRNLSWTSLDIKGNDVADIPFQPMTDEWELLVGSAFSSNPAKVAIKVKSNGNVGIGTRNPRQKLTVSGEQQYNQGAPTAGNDSSAILRLQASNLGYGEVLDFGMNIQPSYSWIQPQDLNSSTTTYNLCLNPKGGNVGIGNTQPKAKLDVSGGINIAGEYAIQLSGEDINHGVKLKRYFQNSSDLLDGPFIYGYSGGSLGIKRGDEERHILNWNTNGNIGIGTNKPQSQLHLQFLNSEPKSIQFIQFTNTAQTMNGAIRYTWYNEYCDVGIVRGWSDDISAYAIKFNGNEKARFSANGNAAFQGKVEAKDFVVSASPTADFVFAPDYHLRGMQDLEKFISEKQHLPEIPSAKEMTENGVTIGKFQIKLLQKIEELTLYTLAQHKEIEQLKLRIQ